MPKTGVRLDWSAAAAFAIWICFALAIAEFVATHPGQRTVTPTYRTAVDAWFSGGRLYNDSSDIGGFLYFPQAALLYVPFAALPLATGEVLWRLCSLALLATGLWRLARVTDSEQSSWFFLLFTLLCLPATVSSARNGQMNLAMCGLMLHATTDVVRGVWWRASLALTLALALKPHAIVPLLLVAVMYPRTRWWFAGMIVGTAAVPFLLQRPDYVVEQYRACIGRIVFATTPVTDTWSDLRGLLLRMGIDISNSRLLAVRLAAALPTLMLCFVARRHGRAWTAIYVFALACVYLMLFNPRNEANSYVILAPAVAALATAAMVQQRTMAFCGLTVFAAALGCENYGPTIFAMTDLWFKPLLTLIFFVYLIREICGACAEALAPGRSYAALS